MSDYYDTLGRILRDRLGTDDDPFDQALHGRQGKYRNAANKIGKRSPQIEPVFEEASEPVRVPIPPALAEDFAVLHLLPGMPLADCKQSWKRLLKKYHPDLNERPQEEADSIVRRLNRSYRRIESWFQTGSIAEDTNT